MQSAPCPASVAMRRTLSSGAVPAQLIKALRERTGAPILECKKALQACQLDTQGAVEWLRKSGLNVANKLSARNTATGLVCAITSSDRNNFIPKAYQKSQKSNLSRVQWLAAEGSPSKALSTLTSSGIAAVNDRSYKLMCEKHPNEEEAELLFDLQLEDKELNLSVPIFTPENCLKALQDFDRTTGTGPSGIRVSYILDCILAEPGEHSNLLKLWSQVLYSLACGEAPESISSFVNGAKLVALEKPKLLKDGLPDLRPIAVGELIRRWVGKILINISKSQITNFFQPFQLGVGTNCGAEIIYRAVKSRMLSDDKLVLLQVDLSNAFNLCDRKTFLRELKQFPSLFYWTRWIASMLGNL